MFDAPSGGRLVGWLAVVGERALGPDSLRAMVLDGTAYMVLPTRRADLTERVFEGPVNLYSDPVPTLQFVSDFGPQSTLTMAPSRTMRFRPPVEYVQVGNGDLQTINARALRRAFRGLPGEHGAARPPPHAGGGSNSDWSGPGSRRRSSGSPAWRRG